MQLECNFVLTMRMKSIDGVQLAMPLNMWPATIHYAHTTAQLYELEVNDAITSNMTQASVIHLMYHLHLTHT